MLRWWERVGLHTQVCGVVHTQVEKVQYTHKYTTMKKVCEVPRLYLLILYLNNNSKLILT